MNNNRCVKCNEIIPEGRQVCPNCESSKAKAEKVLETIKSILIQDIERLKQKVKDEEENTAINGMRIKAESILQTIKNYEELPEWYFKERERK